MAISKGTQYITNPKSFPKEYNNVQEMIDDPFLEVGFNVRTLGYTAKGDGGGNDYEIVASATGTDDGGSYIDLTGSGFQARGLFPDGLNVEQFGVLPGAPRVENDASIVKLLTYSSSEKKVAKAGPGTFLFSSGFSMPELAGIIGQGAQRTIFDFEDSDGINAEVSPTALNSYGRMGAFTIRGNADSTSDPSATQGLIITKSNYWKTFDLLVTDFVHNVTLTGADGFIQGFDMNIDSFSTKYPNSVNGYPDTLFRVIDSTSGKPQAGSFTGIFYAQLITEQANITAAGGQTDFVIDWSSSGSNKAFDLYKETGIKVGVEEDWGAFTRQTIGVDYDLYVEWNASEYNIPPGTEYVRDYVRTQSGDSNAEARKITVRFLSGRSSGDKIRIQWNDPTANFALQNNIGTGLKFNVQVGGADTLIYSNAPDCEYKVRYAQMTNNLFQMASDADFCTLDYTEAQGGTIDGYLQNGADVTRWDRRANRAQGKPPSDEIVTSTTDVVIVNPVSFTVHNPLPRHVFLNAMYTLEHTSDDARALVTIQRSTQGNGASANWSDVNRILLESAHGGSTTTKFSGTASADKIETDIQQGFLGRKPVYYYRVVARVLDADTTLTIQGGDGAQESVLRIEEKQPE